MKKIASVILVFIIILSAMLSVGAQKEIPPVEQIFTAGSNCYFVRNHELYSYNSESMTETKIMPSVSHILDIYDNQYLYYASADYMVAGDGYKGSSIHVYDIKTGNTLRVYNSTAEIARNGDKVYLEDLNGVSSGARLQEANLDGSDAKVLSESCLSKIFIGEEIYFCETQDHTDVQNPVSVIKKYNHQTGETQTLTPPFVGFVFEEDLSPVRALVRSGWDENIVAVLDFSNQKRYAVEDGAVYEILDETNDKKMLISGENIHLYDVYQNHYLYLRRQNPATDFVDDLVIYDLKENKEIFTLENNAYTLLYEDRIYTGTNTSAISPSVLKSFRCDGTDEVIISNEVYTNSWKPINHYLYYCNFENSDYDNPTCDIRRLDMLSGETEILTPRINGVANRHCIDTEGALVGPYFLNRNWQEYIYYSEEADKEIQVMLNGEPLTFDRAPIHYKDRVMVPIRTIFEALEYEVTWNEETDTAIATKDDDIIHTAVGKCAITRGNTISYSDVAPINVSGRVMVPVRAIAEITGCTVTWDEETKTVLIEK